MLPKTLTRKFVGGSLIVLTAALIALPAIGADTRDLAQEERNQSVVLKFYEAFFNGHDVGAAERFVVPNYVQHNPRVPDGREPFVAFFKDRFAKFPQSHSSVVQVATAGELVFLHVKAVSGPTDRGTAIVDIFRVADGKIVEHWDVVQPVPETSANNNTMF